MPEILILADDLSGAADCAVAWTGRGMRTVVLLDAAGAPGDARVAAVDLDSRALGPEPAGAAAADAIRRHHVPDARLLYQKMDSTLRGNWVAELAAIRRAAAAVTGGAPLAVVAPAFPATGRQVVQGRALLERQPLEETEVWEHAGLTGPADVVESLRRSGLGTKLMPLDQVRSDDPGRRFRTLAATGCDAVVCDAETDADLLRIAAGCEALGLDGLGVGSAGLMQALAGASGSEGRTNRTMEWTAVVGPILFAVGSASTVSRRQYDTLGAEPGLAALGLPASTLRSPGGERAAGRALDAALAAGKDVALTVQADGTGEEVGDARLAAALGALLAPRLSRVDALVMTGGETARAILAAAGIGRLELAGEVEPGVPLSRAGRADGIAVVTKAGAFGDRGTLVRVREALKGHAVRPGHPAERG